MKGVILTYKSDKIYKNLKKSPNLLIVMIDHIIKVKCWLLSVDVLISKA